MYFEAQSPTARPQTVRGSPARDHRYLPNKPKSCCKHLFAAQKFSLDITSTTKDWQL
jgi:hypothetical protein